MNQPALEFAPRPELEYPFDKQWSPEPGEPFAVADGVYWLRMPLPIALDHINLWILKDGSGWTLVDSGYDAPVCKEVWETVFATFLDPSTVKRIIVTHFHPDHIGLASWLAHRCDCPILISRGEFELYSSIVTRDQSKFDIEVGLFLKEMGFDAAMAEKLVSFFVTEKKPDNARVQEHMCEFIADGDQITINDRLWSTVSGNGHSPEHQCLYCEELKIMISGDQSLPRISSNVSVYPTNRHDDPLGDWLDSCEKLRTVIPDETLILPSHQEPFYGNKARMQQLIDDHHVQLNCLRLAVHAPISAVQARAVLFNRELSIIGTMLATGETLAHLNYLMHRHEITVEIDSQGVARYSAVG